MQSAFGRLPLAARQTLLQSRSCLLLRSSLSGLSRGGALQPELSIGGGRRHHIVAALGSRGVRCNDGLDGQCVRSAPSVAPGGLTLSTGSTSCKVCHLRAGIVTSRSVLIQSRFASSRKNPGQRSGMTWKDLQRLEDSNQSVWWIAVGVMGVFGCVWLLVPLYKMYCQTSGQGQAQVGHKEYAPPPSDDPELMKRLITVDFAGTVHDALPWDFVPQQRRVVVGIGETCLAFYRAKNNTDRPIIGVSVYHMLPPESGLYFNKIQCFCFDEQLINPNEEVDLPIFFFIDPMMAQDGRMDHVDRITLSYLFFESDSDLPDEYQQYVRSSRSEVAPPTLAAAAPAAASTAP